MSSLDVWFGQVWDAVVEKVKTVTDFGQNVFYSKKFPVTAFPSAFVQPSLADSSPKTFKESEWFPVFRIYIVVENVDPKEGVLSAWKLAWKVTEALEANRTLGELLHSLECGPIEDSPEGLGRGTEQHWACLSVKCQRKI